jgi:transposase InsO family protein
MRATSHLALTVPIPQLSPGVQSVPQVIEQIAAVKRRYGYRRIHVLLRREGWRINRKPVALPDISVDPPTLPSIERI